MSYDRRMKAVWLVALVACAHSAEAKPHPIVQTIAYACFHSDQPFGHGQQDRKVAYDLAAATRTETNDNVVNADGPPQEPNAPNKDTHTRVVTKLAPARVDALRTAANEVASGGPYKDEYPVSEGTSCTLTLADPKGAVFFTIVKSDPKIDDAPTRLLKLFD
jgi:hypothetical protein